MSYVYWLAILSVVFVLLERVRPRYREQRVLRRGIITDLVYLVFNGHFLGVLLAHAAYPAAAAVDSALGGVGLLGIVHLKAVAELPTWAQFVIALLVMDLLHWGIHNLLHRVPFLWELHKVHHSIEIMDWFGSLRFHWGEVVVYKSLSYLPLAFLGVRGDVLLWLAVFNTAVGHFNHANLSVSIGPLRYLLNNPAMHIWHHTHSDAGPINRNFGISLSLWDWLFRTAYLPERPPERLAFEGIEAFPSTAPGQVLHPLPVERRVRRLLQDAAKSVRR